LDTLSEHLAQTDNHKKHKAVYDKYIKLDPKKRDAFYEKHSNEIEIYKGAKNYLDKIMNGRKDIPIKAWQKEQRDLLTDRYDLMEKYYQLKDETRSIELLRRGAENIMRGDTQESPPTRKHEIYL
jgi:hypothetical protein